MQIKVQESTQGVVAGLTAFFAWGFLILFWKLLDSVPAFEILCYRIVFSLVVVTPVILFTGRGQEVLQAFSCSKTRWTLLLSALTVALNWFLYIWAISANRVLDTSLGYYINPLMNVFLGCLFLRERPSRLQGLAIALACLGVGWSVLRYGQMPWLPLGLAASFALYGLIRKTVDVEALPGLFWETAVLTPFALGWLLWLAWQGEGFLVDPSLSIGVLLFLSGPITSFPLALFAYAARHMRLMTIGILQYISPTCGFLIGLFVLHEPLAEGTLVTFVCIWIALLIYTLESWRLLRHRG